jgi:hypothetical protein
MARKARRPRATFVRTAVALTALSFVPDLTFGFDAGSAATLITLHTVAAAIVVPTLARRLARALTRLEPCHCPFARSTPPVPPHSGATPVAVVKTRTKGRKGRWPRSHEGSRARRRQVTTMSIRRHSRSRSVSRRARPRLEAYLEERVQLGLGQWSRWTSNRDESPRPTLASEGVRRTRPPIALRQDDPSTSASTYNAEGTSGTALEYC